MYTTMKSPLGRLRAYRRELEEAYAQALNRRDVGRARQLQERRRSVQRAILVREEWSESPAADPDLDRLLASILNGT